MAMSDAAYQRGLRLYKGNKIRSFRVEMHGESFEQAYLYARVEGSSQNVYNITVLVEDERVRSVCQCPASYEYQGLCKHVVAVLLRFLDEKETFKENLQKKKEQMAYGFGETLLSYYESTLLKNIESEKIEEPIELFPKLSFNYSGKFVVSLSVGNKRPYVVKDLYQFAQHVQEEEFFAYGKNLSFIHKLEHFSDESRPLTSFIVNKATEYEDAVGVVQGSFNKKILPLGPASFREFFEMLEGKWIEFEDGYEKILLQRSNPPLSFLLTKEGEKFALRMKIDEGSRLGDLVSVPYGKDTYIFVRDKLFLCEETFTQVVFPLVEAFEQIAEEQEEVKMIFNEKGMKRFLVSVFPNLKKHVPVEVQEGLMETYAPLPLKTSLYLDRDRQGSIVGYCEFTYGDTRFNPYTQKEDEVKDIARDVAGEHHFHQLLSKYSFHTQKGKLHITEEEEIYTFLTEGIGDFLNVGEVHVTEALKQMQFAKPPIGNVGVKLKTGLLEISFEDINLPVEEMRQILEAYTIKRKYYRLKNGSFVDFSAESMIDVAELLMGLDIGEKELKEGKVELSKYRALYLDSLLKNKETLSMERNTYFKKLIRDMKNIEDADYELPRSLKKVLRSYQKTGYRWLSAMADYGFGGILADDMGLGKTLQMIALLLKNKEETQNGRGTSLVVAPTSLVLNWQKEIEKFSPSLQVLPVTGSVEERKEKIATVQRYDVLLTSYDLLKRDIDLYRSIPFKYCIADEAHYIKNPQTQNAKSLKLVQSEVRFALTGTPMENALSELWSLFDFIMPDYLLGYTKFKQTLETPITKNQDERATLKLQKMTRPFILRRLKKDVLKELPDKTQTVMYNRMEDEQRKLYEANALLFKKEMARELEANGMGKSQIKILSLLTRLRQLCCHPKLYLADYEGESSKLTQCLELIEESVAGGHKILLFSQFTSMLELIRQAIVQKGISYDLLTGQTKAEERLAKVDAFNQNDTSVFLISLKAGGTGLNLTGADIVIHYDPWWNLSSQNQATDRAYRIGQKNKVQVFDLITVGTIEEKIKKLQERKVQLSEAILTEGQSFIHQMTQEELMELFSVE